MLLCNVFLIFKEEGIIFNIKKDKRCIVYVNEVRKGGMLHLNVVGHSVGQNVQLTSWNGLNKFVKYFQFVYFSI